jgi:uncharacterized protein (DUF58 family)
MSQAPAGPFTLIGGELADRIRQLELFSRFRVEGTLHGPNKSPFKGFTADFLQHRQYFPGDNLKYLDWRVYGKTDKLFIREYEELTNARLSVILDLSGSMGHQSGAYSKHGFAIRAAAILLYLAQLHRDSFGVSFFREGAESRVPFGSGRTHLMRAYQALLEAGAEGGTDFEQGLRETTGPLRRRGLTVVLSDFMGDPEAIGKRLAHLRLRGSDVIAMQVFDPQERELDFNTITRFHDPEGPEILVVDPQLVRRQYAEAFEAHQVALKEACRRRGFEHVALPVADEFHVPVLEYIHWRLERFS